MKQEQPQTEEWEQLTLGEAYHSCRLKIMQRIDWAYTYQFILRWKDGDSDKCFPWPHYPWQGPIRSFDTQEEAREVAMKMARAACLKDDDGIPT